MHGVAPLVLNVPGLHGVTGIAYAGSSKANVATTTKVTLPMRMQSKAIPDRNIFRFFTAPLLADRRSRNRAQRPMG